MDVFILFHLLLTHATTSFDVFYSWKSFHSDLQRQYFIQTYVVSYSKSHIYNVIHIFRCSTKCFKYLRTLNSSRVIDLQNEATAQLLQESVLVFLHAQVLLQILEHLKSKMSNDPRQLTRFKVLLSFYWLPAAGLCHPVQMKWSCAISHLNQVKPNVSLAWSYHN